MNSSISSSEPGWRRFLRVYVATLAALGAACVALVLTIDPYNTGMLTPVDRIVSTYEAPRFGNAARARDPQFDGAIFGNSTGQLLDPERLGRLVGSRLVSLTIGGSGPVEQLVTMEYFRRHHPGRARTLIVSMDTSWCHADRYFARDRIAHPFPFWLYDGDRLAYAARAITFEAIGLSGRKVMIALGLSRPRARADGYDNFELGRMWRIDEAWQRLGMDARIIEWMSVDGAADMDSFAALDALDAFIGGLPNETKAALVFTPYYAGSLPEPGSSTARRLEACKMRVVRPLDAIALHDDPLLRQHLGSLHARLPLPRLLP
jgi:hypothetical protein